MNARSEPTFYRGRWAPSPTGSLHLGNARTALVAWLAARSAGGTFVWRTEDLDEARCEPALADEMMTDLRWLGIDWDEGPKIGGPYGPYVQSGRHGRYYEALERLYNDGSLYPCRVSRRDLAEIATAPHGRTPSFPEELRPDTLDPQWWDKTRAGTSDAAVRFRVDPGVETFDDLLAGRQSQDVAVHVGDFVLLRRDGVFAYQLAVVADDIAMRITDVVRGADLLESTGRQIRLCRALGGDTMRYGHVPIVYDHHGEKLSKRHQHLTIASLRENAVEPTAVIGYLAYSLAILPEPRPLTARELVPGFSWSDISTESWYLPDVSPLEHPGNFL